MQLWPSALASPLTSFPSWLQLSSHTEAAATLLPASCQFPLTGEGGCPPRAIINCVCSASMCIFICAFIPILNGAVKLLYDLASGQISIEFHNQSLCSCIYGKVGGGVVFFQIFVSPRRLLTPSENNARGHVKGQEHQFLPSGGNQDSQPHSTAPHIFIR